MAEMIAGGRSTVVGGALVTHPELVDSLAGYATLDGTRTAEPRATGAVVLTWDDGYESWDDAGTIMDAVGARGTFSVTSDRIGVELPAATLASLAASGHEIGSHGVTHTSMTGLSAAQRVAEWDDSKTAIEAVVGAGTVTTWAYPSGARTAATDQECYLRYGHALLVGGAAYTDQIYLQGDRPDFLVYRYSWTQATHANVLRLIAHAAAHPVTVVLMVHDLATAGLGPSVAEFTAAMALVESLGVPCLTVAEAFRPEPGLDDPGFEDSTLSAWGVTKADPGQVAESAADTPDEGLTGTRSLHLQSSATGSVYVRQSHPMRPGTSYTLSFRYRITAGTTLFARFGHVDSVRSSYTTSTATGLTSETWARATVAGTGHASASRAQIEFGVTDTGEAWVDHVHFGPTNQTALG